MSKWDADYLMGLPAAKDMPVRLCLCVNEICLSVNRHCVQVGCWLPDGSLPVAKNMPMCVCVRARVCMCV